LEKIEFDLDNLKFKSKTDKNDLLNEDLQRYFFSASEKYDFNDF
jgi:hypothetical protein